MSDTKLKKIVALIEQQAIKADKEAHEYAAECSTFGLGVAADMKSNSDMLYRLLRQIEKIVEE